MVTAASSGWSGAPSPCHCSGREGRRRRARVRLVRPRKYPHAGGEDVASKGSTRVMSETPPHAWGRRSLLYGLAKPHGNTPTGVGKTAPAPTTTSRPWKHPTGVGKTDMQRLPQLCHEKHPHGCGEDSVSHRAVFSLSETPPRVWEDRSRADTRTTSSETPHGCGKTASPP